jgi:hypothetical protein
LGRFQRPFDFTIPTGRKDACAIRQSGKCLYAEINPSILPR